MDAQELFDKMAIGTFDQGKQAYNGAQCFYRSPDGLKCAVGQIIPDDKYNPTWDEYCVSGVSVCKELGFITTDEGSKNVDMDERAKMNVINRLQSLHDGYDTDHHGHDFRSYWCGVIRNSASSFQIDGVIIDNFLDHVIKNS